jgi:hypothetical protein
LYPRLYGGGFFYPKRKLFLLFLKNNLVELKKVVSLHQQTNTKTKIMTDFTAIMIGRRVEVSFDHPKYVIARFKAQSTSWACQGQWGNEMVSILKNEYSIERLEAEVKKGFNVHYY